MYASPYNTERAYTGQSLWADRRCPVCGTTGGCLDFLEAPLTYPPIDFDDSETGESGGPLLLYAVTAGQYTSVMQLNESDAARYGPAATLMPPVEAQP